MAPTARPTLDDVDAWWRAANYLSVGQLYLLDNPLLRRPLTIDDIKRRLLGHWGTCPGINLVWAHLNRIIVERDVSALFVCGPGHGGPATVANPWLEHTYSELYPDVTFDVGGLTRLFRQFSFPGGVPSHAAPETPGSLHEGGELGYSLAHAFGAALDRPGTLNVCVIGDGEAETGALAASWHSHRFINPAVDGAVLPILHLNGYKIANPTILARMPDSQLRSLMVGYGYEPWVVDGDDPADVHRQLATALDEVVSRIESITERHRPGAVPTWPMIVLRTPKGWTGPESIDGDRIEGHFRSHQVPIGHDLGAERLVEELESWLRSYRPDELFSPDGSPSQRLDVMRPTGERRMSANPAANATEAVRPLVLPDIANHLNAVAHDRQAADGDMPSASAMRAAGGYLRDVIAANDDRFRLFGPDEVDSNRLSDVFDVTDRAWSMPRLETDVHLAPSGRVMEVLSEHLCQGWLEGYVLTGRHGVFTSYEAFIHIVDSMFNQHAKWLESANEVRWRQTVPSINYLLSSHVWRQDHNGFSHQDPGFLDIVANKDADVVRIYLPPDANTLIATLDHCLRSRQRVNVIVAGKHPEPLYLGADDAVAHLDAGASIWHWAGTERAERTDHHPDVVLGCAGDVPTMETVAAAEILAAHTTLSIRVVNVIDLTRLQSHRSDPRRLDDAAYDRMFPPGVPTVFAFHGFPSLVHQLTYKRHHHGDLHVHGFLEQGTTTTPFDMAVRNRIDRFHLAIAALEHQPPKRRSEFAPLIRHLHERLDEHQRHIQSVGEDMEQITSWRFER